MKVGGWGGLVLLAALVLPVVAGAGVESGTDAGEVRVVPIMDPQRYTGTWYEIARIPNSFQRDCDADVTAHYSVRDDGTIRVGNRCHDSDGRLIEADGLARIKAPGDVNTRLEVRFAPRWMSWMPMVWADYYVIELDANYRYSVVATPDREYLWVLSRTPTMDASLYAELLDRARGQGFDVGRLVPTRQGGEIGTASR